VYVGARQGMLDGYAVISAEVGKFKPITFLTALDRDRRVRSVAIMVYRESHGGEVRSPRFLRQFEARERDSSFRLHRDIINISGATMSASALCRGVKKVLHVMEEIAGGRSDAAVLAEARRDGKRVRGNEGRPALSGGRFEAERYVMGTRLKVVALVSGPEQQRAAQQALGEAEQLERVLSDYQETSELSTLNRLAPGRPHAVSAPLLEFLRQSRRIHRETAGAFDPTLRRLSVAYGFRDGEPRLPPAAERARLVAEAGMDGVELDVDAGAVTFRRPGIELDPGGIGKGMALDAVAAALKQAGVRTACLSFGSTHLAFGPGEDGRGWPVEIAEAGHRDRSVQTLWLRDAACSTSGCGRFVTADGRTIGHILDPRTGEPVSHTASASVLASTATRADALSTALLVLGGERGRAVLDALGDASGFVQPAGAAAFLASDGWPGAPVPRG